MRVATLLMLAPFAGAGEVKATGHDRMQERAGDFALKMEPGVAFPLTDPQAQIFKTGGGQSVKGLWSLNSYLDLGPSVTFIGLPAESSSSNGGTAWAFGGSLRLKGPHDVADGSPWSVVSPWADLDAVYVRTGGLNRAGFAAAAGLSMPVGESRSFWIGPFVRYFEILQPNRDGYDNHDAKILSLGVSLEVGAGVRREPEAIVAAPAPSPAPVTVNKDVYSCPDRDGDDVQDRIDHCPDVAGPLDNWGCPTYDKVVVKRDRLELKEKLFFAWDQAVLLEASFPVLDDVVRALKDSPATRVQVEGHASSEGADDHNQTLSERRAEAVLDYLVAHGIAKERLVSKGFSSSVPLDTNATVAGRERNRRVEFVVQFTVLDAGSK